MCAKTLVAAALAAGSLATAWPAVPVQTIGGKKYTEVVPFGGTDGYDIVFIGDGFTADQVQQDLFNKRVDDAVAALKDRAPYSGRMCAFNIWRVNVISPESGVDRPADTSPIVRNTALDCRYGAPARGEPERCITSDSIAKCIEAANHAPAHDIIVVLVNDTKWGGCTETLVFCSIGLGFAGIVTHELGHKIGWLADEYDYYFDVSDTPSSYSGPEPPQVNLTKESAFDDIKWNDLIKPGTTLPTEENLPDELVVGAWEGGGHYNFGLFRPQSHCLMRFHSGLFCPVCEREMRARLESHCSLCELGLFTFICNPEFPLEVKFLWREPFRWRWPWPPCLSCPPGKTNLTEEVFYTVRGVPKGFNLRTMDDRNRVVAQGVVKDGGLRVSFEANKAKQYFIELSSELNGKGEPLTLSSEMIRNGELQRRSSN